MNTDSEQIKMLRDENRQLRHRIGELEQTIENMREHIEELEQSGTAPEPIPYQAFFRHMPMPAAIFQTDGSPVTMNQQYSTRPYLPHELGTEPHTTMIERGVFQQGHEPYMKHILDGETVQQAAPAEGAELTYFPLYNAGGDIDYVGIIAQEPCIIHQDTQNDFQTLFETLEDFLVICDVDGAILHVNPALRQRLGYTDEELRAKNILELHSLDQRDRAATILSDVIASRAVFCPVPLQAKDGTLIPVETRVTYGVWKNQDVLFGLSRDIAERLRIEEALRESEEKFRRFFEQSWDGLVLLDEQGWIIEWNQGSERIRGFSRAEVLGKPIWDVLVSLAPEHERTPATYERVRSVTLDLLRPDRAPRMFQAEGRTVHRADGKQRIVHSLVFPIQTARGLKLGSITRDITELKQAEEAIHESQRLLQGVLDYSPALISVKDMQRRYMLANRQFLSLLGREEHEVLGKTTVDLYTPETAEAISQREQQVLDSGSPIEFEEVLTFQDCEYTYISIIFPLYDNLGQIYAIGSIATDISERKASETTLRLFKTIVEHSQEAIAISDPQGQLVYINPAHQRLFGRTLEEARRMNYRDFYPPESVAVLNHEVAPTLAQGGSWEGIIDVFDARGRRFPLWERADGVYDSDGTLLFAFGLMHDATAHKQMSEALEEALQQSEALLHGVVEHSSAAIYVRDAQGRYVLVNHLACALLGLERDQITGKTDDELPPKTATRTWRSNDRHVFASGRSAEFEETFLQEGVPHTYLSMKFPLYDAQGAIYAVGCIASDITMRKQVEEALRQSEARMQLVVQHMPILLAAIDEQGTYVCWNEEGERVTGYRNDEIVGLTLDEVARLTLVIPPNQEEQVLEELRQLMCREFRHYELYMRAKNGSVKTVAWSNISNQFAIPGWTFWAVGVDITERKRIEQAWQISQALLKAVIENSSASIYVKDTQGRYLFVDRRTARSLKIPQEEIIGKTDDDFFLPDIVSNLRETEQRVIETRQPVEREEMVPKDDGLHTYLSVKFPIYDETNNLYAVGGISTDISERKRIEQALAESEAHYRMLVETSPNAILRTDPDGTIRFCNQQAAMLFGYEQREELYGKICTELLHADEADAQIAYINALREASYSRDIEYRMRRRDGSVFPAEINSAVMTNTQGQQVALIMVIRNITERKQAEQALTAAYNDLEKMNEYLARNRNLLHAIFDSLEDGLLLVDGSGYVQAANTALIRLLGCGCSPTCLIGKNWDDTYIQAVPDFPGHVALNPPDHRQNVSQLHRYQHPDGSTRILDIKTIALRDSDQTVDQVILHIVDTTEKSRLQAQVIENERFAASGRLAASVAHEINTPLQSLQTALVMVRIATDSEREVFLDHALKEIERVGRIVRQFLDLYRPGAATPGPVDIAALLERILLLVGKRLRDQQVVVEYDLAPDMPALWGRTDELMQVMLNLIVNALDAMPEGGTLRIHTSEQDPTSSQNLQPPAPPMGSYMPGALPEAMPWRAHIDISDTGHGISPELLPRIFEPFVTVREHGTGLGLAISTQIIHQHGGTIAVQSQPNSGSTFTIELPLIRAHNGEASS
jgi:PAS domain S-box-containing protein